MTALFVALCAAALAGQPPAVEPQTGASRVALAAVTDPRNRPLVDVGADDFVIQESGTAREVLSVRPADYPIVVLLDTGEAARADFALMRAAVAQFIARIGQRPIVIGTFGNAPAILTSFEDDRQSMMERLSKVEPEAAAASLLLQGAALAGGTIRETGTLFSAIVIVSATAEDGSRSPVDEMLAPIVDSGAALHVIAYRPAQAAAPAAPAASPGPSLRMLAQQTHGEYTTIYTAASYQAALDRLADRMSAEMMIEYLVPVGSKPKDVKVGTHIIGARVRGLGVAPR